MVGGRDPRSIPRRRAPKQNPAIFALAAVFGVGDSAARKAATENFSAIIPLAPRTTPAPRHGLIYQTL
jgi:hypothetical protein